MGQPPPETPINGTGNSNNSVPPLAKVRRYKDRASYSTDALKEIFRAQPLAHVAFAHSGKGLEGTDGEERSRILNMPTLVVLEEYHLPDDDEDPDGPEQGELVVYLHSNPYSRLIQAVKEGCDTLTITTSIIDGLIFAPTTHDHSVNYRSATIHAYAARVLSNSSPGEFAEKSSALARTTDTVTGYERTARLGGMIDKEVQRTGVVRARIEAASCKQRIGGRYPDRPPIEREEEENLPQGHGFVGVVPCWTEFGEPRGLGAEPENDNIGEIAKTRSTENREYALKVAMAETRVDGRPMPAK